MLTMRVSRLRRADPGALDVPRRGVAHRVAAAAHAELAADRRQRQHRHRRVAAVAVALEAPAAADQRRRARRRTAAATRSSAAASTPATSRRALERPRLGALAQPVGAGGVLAQERLVGVAVREQVAVDRERDGDVGARLDRQMHVGARAPAASSADRSTTSLRAALLRLAHVRHEVNAGRRRVDAPQDDQLRVRIVLVGDRRHLAVERHVGRAGRRRAHRARQPRRAEAPPQLRVEVVLRQQAVRAAVRVRQDRFGAACVALRRSNRDRRSARALRPTSTRLNWPVAFAAAAHRRIQQPVGAVDALAELAGPSRRCSRR